MCAVHRVKYTWGRLFLSIPPSSACPCPQYEKQLVFGFHVAEEIHSDGPGNMQWHLMSPRRNSRRQQHWRSDSVSEDDVT